MSMNLQNKIYGRKMGVVGLTQEMFSNKPK